MEEAGGVEQQAVAAMEVDGEDRRACFAGEARGDRVPGRVCDGAAAQVEVRDIAGGEDGQGAARAEVAQSGGDGRGVARCGGGGAEGVDEDVDVAQLRDGAEEAVGGELHVRPDPAEQGEQRQSVGATEGVVGDDQEGAGRGNSGEDGGGDADGYVQ